MDRLALTKAIAQHETAYCTKGSGITHNNCFGTMTWVNGPREFARFETKQEGFDYTYGLIGRMYANMTLKDMAVKYSGDDRAEAWENNVRYYYEKFNK